MFSTKSRYHSKGLRFRLTLVYSTLFGLVLSLFAFILAGEFKQASREDFDSALLNYALDLSDYVHVDRSGFKVDYNLHGSELMKEFPFLPSQTYYLIRSIDGHVLARSLKRKVTFNDIPYNPELASKEDYTHRFLTLSEGQNTLRAVNLKMTNDLGQEMILQVATLANILEDREEKQILMIISMVPLLILVSSLASYLIAGKALSPIRDLTATANSIAAKNLSLRVPVLSTGDEIEELSKTFNTLLERLEKSFKAQENFVADASHQLNTPLSIIKGELDVLESKPRTPEDITRFQRSLREELERLIEMVKKLLVVSRVESGQESFIFKPIRLDDLLLGTSARLLPKAKLKHINLRFNISEALFAESIVVQGDKQLLDCLFENLLDNAIKYSPASSTVSIEISRDEKYLKVSIQDEGSGISEEELKAILTKRFKRASHSTLPGTGIGLSIAHQIAEHHSAMIHYKKLQPQGSLFFVLFHHEDPKILHS
ncbi:MAG TPA: ATP-binding protein [Bacteriovoracaceae bacterium]|nr:ATP-binding protein [Bacteriovoracaceae bacterium]